MVASWPIEQPILTAFSFIGFLLSVVPLCWQLEGVSDFILNVNDL